jgi:ubiquinone/menaquinone biosynthesis C-methylase UbiE
MTPGPVQRPGEAFDAVAEAYDAVRPGYPEDLVDLACSLGSLEPGSRVLEVGCGTGKLTEALVERRLRVEAVDPGPSMIEIARRRTGHSEAVTFHVGRFEDVVLPEGAFDAVFSATAFHWVDPSVGWAKAARALRPGGMLALLMHIGYHEDETFAASEALRLVLKKHFPDGGTWQPLRDLATLRAGAEERRDNVSAVWTWLGHKDLTRSEAAPLFDDARLATFSIFSEQTADELWARLETSSSYQRLDSHARAALERDVRDTVAGLGGTIRESDLAVLVTAHSAPDPRRGRT